MPTKIDKWMSTKEIYFSLVVEKFSWLNNFHKSVLFNKKKRSQIAEDILKSNNKELFLIYLDKRGIYVDLNGVNEINYDFSDKWLRMFIEENHKRIKKVDDCDYNFTTITFENNGEIFLAMPTEKYTILKDSFSSILKSIPFDHIISKQKTKNNDQREAVKKSKDMCPYEEYLLRIYESKDNDVSQNMLDFKRPGVLNKFISSHIYDLEGSARVTASVIRDVNQYKDFLRTIPFVIEDKESIPKFIHHLLRYLTFTIPYNLIKEYADRTKSIVLAAKVDVNDLDELASGGYYTKNTEIGILLRGYSYLLINHPTDGKFKKVKDGDVTFYYSTKPKNSYNLEILYKDEVITYICDDEDSFVEQIMLFAKSSYIHKKDIVLRCLKILKRDLPSFKIEEKVKNPKQLKEEDLIKTFIANPWDHLNFLPKLVEIGFEPKKETVFDLVDILKDVRGENEKFILELIRSFSMDKEMTIYILNHFEYFSFSTKLRIVSILKGPIDLKIFVKYCEIIGNEENFEVLKCILEDLKERKVYFPIIEQWKSNTKLTKLLIRIYPLGMKDKEFYDVILEKCNEEEKNMILEVYKDKI
jgi:ribosomal protein S18